MKLKNYIIIIVFALIAWMFGYAYLQTAAQAMTYGFLKLIPGSALASSVEFFIYDAPKVLMLLALAVFGIGILRTFITAQQTGQWLAGRREFLGNILASLLGVVTPFCSCSAVPLFIGFVTGGIPLGVTFSFLISAPMINEIALVLLFGMFGWKIALLYLLNGLLIALVSGWILGRLHMEKYVEEWVYQSMPAASKAEDWPTWPHRIDKAWKSVKDIVGRVWLYVVGGIAVGAVIHGYVPENFLAAIMGKQAWWSVPMAVLIGIPLYSNAAGILPIVQILLEKGAALGTVLAFMMAVIGLSLPETIVLRKVLKPRLIAVFLGVVASGILMVGYLFNLIL